MRISGHIINQNKYIIKEDKIMMKALKKVNWKKLGIFAGGVLFGTAGIKVLSSKDAKNVYTHSPRSTTTCSISWKRP